MKEERDIDRIELCPAHFWCVRCLKDYSVHTPSVAVFFDNDQQKMISLCQDCIEEVKDELSDNDFFNFSEN